jgi:membrane peptidoglycan carboxypeptidase
MTRLLAAWMLDAKYEPNAMIDDYARLAYFGRNAFGVNDAAQSWFAKSSGELTSAEAAFLALLLASPSDPTSGEAAARRARIGREIILLRMRQRGFIDDRELEEARAARLGVTPPSQSGSGP